MLAMFKRLYDDTQAVAAVEFALIAPVMVVMFLGMVEVGDALTAKRKVTSAASTAADLVARAKGLDNGDIQDVFAAVEAILEPYDTTHAEIRITSVNVELNGDVVVGWSDGRNITAKAKGDSYTLPKDIGEKGGSVIVAEVHYTHPGLFGTFVANPQTYKDTFISKPRQTLRVARY